MKKALVVLLLLCFLPLHSAQSKKIYVLIEHSGSDRVGISFVYHLKETVSKSSRYSMEDSAIDVNNFRYVYISVLSVKAEDHENSSAIAVTAQKPNEKCSAIFFSEVLAVGSSKSEEVAKDVFASIDEGFSK
jgi:hypothetical protein